METPRSNEPEPTPYNSAEKFSSAMDKIESARQGFLNRVNEPRKALLGEESEIKNRSYSSVQN